MIDTEKMRESFKGYGSHYEGCEYVHADDAKLNMQKRQERQKSDWICAVCDGGPGNYCNCSCPNGPVKQNTGSWLPAPDTTRPED